MNYRADDDVPISISCPSTTTTTCTSWGIVIFPIHFSLVEIIFQIIKWLLLAPTQVHKIFVSCVWQRPGQATMGGGGGGKARPHTVSQSPIPPSTVKLYYHPHQMQDKTKIGTPLYYSLFCPLSMNIFSIPTWSMSTDLPHFIHHIECVHRTRVTSHT